jgi:hypothetical protein
LEKAATTEDFSVVQGEGDRNVHWLLLTNPWDKDVIIRLTMNMLTEEH